MFSFREHKSFKRVIKHVNEAKKYVREGDANFKRQKERRRGRRAEERRRDFGSNELEIESSDNKFAGF